ncbi:hypothetical protein CI610_03295 [invertebrate metagenome]|uniref:Uncharacterized protein n=1 Tax=invertebrate metagenome TaxID=1711999 RepID=A0A2H9T3G6_9ZZZZ
MLWPLLTVDFMYSHNIFHLMATTNYDHNAMAIIYWYLHVMPITFSI